VIALHPDDWAEVIGQDLADFIGAGGAMVRFVVGDTVTDLAHARRSLKMLAEESKLHFFDVNGSQARLHHPNEILAAVADQIDFQRLMTSFLLQAVIAEGYEVPPGATDFILDDVANLNDILPKQVSELIKARIRSGIMRDRRLVRDMRYALWAIAREVLRGVPSNSIGDVPKRWLTGQVSSIKELRDFGIVQKVNRYNARGLLRSLLTWLPTSEWNGSIIFINGLRLAESRNPHDGKVHYTRAALTDVYEVMREFIDETDDMSHLLLVFAMPEGFLSIDPRGRGMGAYQALQFRVSNFSDAKLPNPLSNMVLLSVGAERRAFSA
jgi:hypothetical protein